MNQIADVFSRLKDKKEKALIAFITAGDPDLETTESLVDVLEKSGADIIELGVPFSDPLADGPVIQRAALRSLENGTTLKKILYLVSKIRKFSSIPIVLMSSYNPVFCYDELQFVKDAVSSGVDGVIIPDLPPEEAEELKDIAQHNGLDMIFLVAPTSYASRVKKICDMSTGFLYYVSVTGITGARKELSLGIEEKIKEVKKYSKIPVSVGFGISKPEHIVSLGDGTDGVIVGSAIVKAIEANLGNKPKILNEVAALVSALKEGCKKL